MVWMINYRPGVITYPSLTVTNKVCLRKKPPTRPCFEMHQHKYATQPFLSICNQVCSTSRLITFVSCFRNNLCLIKHKYHSMLVLHDDICKQKTIAGTNCYSLVLIWQIQPASALKLHLSGLSTSAFRNVFTMPLVSITAVLRDAPCGTNLWTQRQRTTNCIGRTIYHLFMDTKAMLS